MNRSIPPPRSYALPRELFGLKAFSAVFTFRAVPRAYQNQISNPRGAR